MDKEGLANKLNGSQYKDGFSARAFDLAKENGLVIVFGASDDLCEFRGAINEEVGCYNGGKIFFNKDGSNFTDEYGIASMTYMKNREQPEPNMINAIWCPYWMDASWGYETDIPHEKFLIWEDEDVYCEGIIFSINDLV